MYFLFSEALELNQQIQQVQQDSSTEMFQLPPGVIPEVTQEPRNHVPMEEGSSHVGSSQSQPHPEPEYTEILEEHTDIHETNHQHNYQSTTDTENFLTNNLTNAAVNRDGSDNHQTLAPVSSKTSQLISSDNFSFQQSNLGLPKTENVFASNSSYSDSIVSQFLENMSAALQSQNQEPINTNSGKFPTSLTTVPTQTHNQITVSTEVRNNSNRSDSHLFSSESVSVASMDFSLNSSPVHVGLHGSHPPENHPISSESSLKEIFGNNILSNLDHLQFSLEKGTPFSPEQVVPNSSQVHLPTDTLTSAREVSLMLVLWLPNSTT